MSVVARKLGAAAVALALLSTVDAGAGQTPALRRVMRQKLAHSERILASVVTSNWSQLEADTRALQQLTADPAWAVLMTPEYMRYTASFSSAAEALLEAARQHDLEATPLAYVSLTLSCVQCHRYVARARIAGGSRRN